MADYIHVLFDTHEIIFAEGAATEGLHPGAAALSGVEAEARDELFAIFPALRARPDESAGPAAHPILKAREARAAVRAA